MSEFQKQCANCGLRFNCDKQGDGVGRTCNDWITWEYLEHLRELREGR